MIVKAVAGRRRPRHAGRARRRRAGRSRSSGRAREAETAFGDADVFLESTSERPSTSRSSSWPTATATSCTFTSATARCSGATRRSWRSRPSLALTEAPRQEICDAAVRLMRHVGYVNAAPSSSSSTSTTATFYFIEVNPRIQVEHTVTELITGMDMVQAQILHRAGHAARRPRDRARRARTRSTRRGYAIQCRITTEDPANKFVPDHGRITHTAPPAGFGVRLDGGNGYHRRRDHAVLRLAAGQGQHAGHRPLKTPPAKMDRGAAGVPHPGREDQHPVPVNVVSIPVPGGDCTTTVHRRHAGAVPVPAAAGPGHQVLPLHRPT